MITLCKGIEDLNSTQNKLAQVVLNNIDATIKSVKEIINDLRPTVLELGLHKGYPFSSTFAMVSQ